MSPGAFVIFFSCLATLVTSTNVTSGSASYQVGTEMFSVSWWWDHDSSPSHNGVVTVRLSVPTTGYVAFGLAEQNSGSMPGSDIVFAWMSGSKITCIDTYATSKLTPELDALQHWECLNGTETSGVTTVYLRRLADTSDPHDRPFEALRDARIVLAWGTEDARTYHAANRLGTTIDFTGSGPLANIAVQLGMSAASIDLAGTTTVTSYDASSKMGSSILRQTGYVVPAHRKTTYICHAYEWATLNITSTVWVRAIGIIVPPVSLTYTHHIIVHACDPDMADGFTTPAECLSPQSDSRCTMMYGWAVGGAPFVFPDGVGLRMGPNTTQVMNKKIVIEIHYDNAGFKSVTDYTGVQLVWTSEPVTHDAGVLSLGDPLVGLESIPSNSVNVMRRPVCGSECTSRWPHDVTVVGDFLHMHDIGTSIYTTIYRAGNLSGPAEILTATDYWSFDYQQNTRVNYKINRGDKVVTSCHYANPHTYPVKFGQASTDEMCQQYLIYYPVMHDYNFCGLLGYGLDRGLCGNVMINQTDIGKSKVDSLAKFFEAYPYHPSALRNPRFNVTSRPSLPATAVTVTYNVTATTTVSPEDTARMTSDLRTLFVAAMSSSGALPASDASSVVVLWEQDPAGHVVATFVYAGTDGNVSAAAFRTGARTSLEAYLAAIGFQGTVVQSAGATTTSGSSSFEHTGLVIGVVVAAAVAMFVVGVVLVALCCCRRNGSVRSDATSDSSKGKNPGKLSETRDSELQELSPPQEPQEQNAQDQQDPQSV